MPDVVGVRFKRCGRIYDFKVDDLDIQKSDLVVVESSFGITIGTIVTDKQHVEKPDKVLKKVLRKVTEEDLKATSENNELVNEARQYCLERISSRGLLMKLVQTEVTLDKKRIIFYFTADGRIDFRELVKDLASKFRTRIEMRQIGVRDETQIIGGLGVCGREVCCRTFLSHFAPISIKMAKSQELVLNTGKLSGLCGRLMCCLGYEVGPDKGIFTDPFETSESISFVEPEEELLLVEEQLADMSDSDEPLTFPSEVNPPCTHPCDRKCKSEEDASSMKRDEPLKDKGKGERAAQNLRQGSGRRESIQEPANRENKTDEQVKKEKRKKRSRHKRHKRKSR